MKFGFTVVATACFGALLLSTGSASANDVGTSKGLTAYESGFEATQGRRRGGRRNTGRNVAIGVGALVLGGVIASQASRASSGRNSCGRWNYQCNRGVRSSCYNLDRYC